MALNRRDILIQLEIILGTITGITTVVRSYGENGIDITQYADTDLPLIDLNEPGESNDEEMTSRRSIQDLEIVLRVYFVDWNDKIQSTYETYIKNIRDKIGSEFKVNNTVTACWITDISKVEGEVPVWHLDMTLNVKYYLNQLST